MAASRLTPEDAREWLETLQQVGEGWYRQVALAIKAGAHKSLGMDRREFAGLIGQRLIDPRPAILELHREGHNQAAIADILGVSPDTTRQVLRDEGVLEAPPLLLKQGEPGETDQTPLGKQDHEPEPEPEPEPESGSLPPKLAPEEHGSATRTLTGKALLTLWRANERLKDEVMDSETREATVVKLEKHIELARHMLAVLRGEGTISDADLEQLLESVE